MTQRKDSEVLLEITINAGVDQLLTSTKEQLLCTGFEFTEGPIWLLSENCLLFSDIPGNRIHRWESGSNTTSVYREPSGHSNGLTIDADGRLLSCEHTGRRVSQGAYGEPAETLVDAFENAKLNSPNDVVVHSSGSIYFTDPTYGLRKPHGINAEQELPHQGVYRVDPDGTLTLLASDFNQPNGLAFTPDESSLYIGDSGDKTIRRFDVETDGSISRGALFCDMRNAEGVGVPDGMKVDEDGRLWTTGVGGVWVIASDGTHLGTFETSEHAANLTFGGPDFSSLFLTAQTSVYRLETVVRGVAPGSR
ncbi:MAG: gluconolactonase [Chloroflexi bacterium]|nr:gluconolactonase [Chloroflexota bacterium]